jgi:uncharacterized protein (TIGR03083 family)
VTTVTDPARAASGVVTLSHVVVNLTVDQIVDGYDQVMTSLIEIGRELGDEDWARETDCPGWSVGDIYAHVVGIERELLGEPLPPEVTDPGAHVKGEVGRHTERAVQAYRGTPREQVLADLDDAYARRSAVLRAPDRPAADDEVPSMMGRRRDFRTVLSVRVFDLWAHEQDIRRATGRPPSLTGPAAEVSFRRILAGIPYVVARQAELPEGTRVQLLVDGIATEYVVREGRRGERVHPGGPAGEQPDVVVSTDWSDLALLATGRRKPEQLAIETSGDPQLAEQLLKAFVVTP